MFVQSLDESPQNHRGGGQTSYLMLGPGQFGSENLIVAWLEGEPGSRQDLHAHPSSEQVYVIVRGRGLMTIEDETREVSSGMLVYIPAGSRHAIEAVGDQQLMLVSALSPPVPSTS